MAAGLQTVRKPNVHPTLRRYAPGAPRVAALRLAHSARPYRLVGSKRPLARRFAASLEIVIYVFVSP
eukprot:662972-Lingulodinium_polyedra.AAC.1